jgi:5-methyltetrahydrofolate--homocysteine methyltransferase
MRPLLDRLHASEVIVGDGAWGTMLIARGGLRPGEPPEIINLTRTDLLGAIAAEYVDAGAQILTTNTFGGSSLRLRAYGLDGDAERINRSAVDAVRGVASGRAHVSASIGPSGHLLAPLGDVTAADLETAFAGQARTLANAGVDVFCVETMTDLEEACIAVRAMKAAAPEIPVIATMTFEQTRRGWFTVMGVPVERAAHGLVDAGADVVGSNCGNGIEAMIAIARAFREATEAPIAIRANAGLPGSLGGTLVYPESPAFFAERVPGLLEAGVQIIGGCCGTSPEHVRAIRHAVTAARQRG